MPSQSDPRFTFAVAGGVDYGVTGYKQVITNTHLPREYCVQAGEADFQFLQRIAAEAGLFHRFAFSADGHRLIHGDRFYIHDAIDAAKKSHA
ncbi:MULTISPECIES: contractile injection system protein, VgrG/Pvc8 family [Cupriavidus]